MFSVTAFQTITETGTAIENCNKIETRYYEDNKNKARQHTHTLGKNFCLLTTLIVSPS